MNNKGGTVMKKLRRQIALIVFLFSIAAISATLKEYITGGYDTTPVIDENGNFATVHDIGIPEYTGEPYYILGEGIPFFTRKDLDDKPGFEHYGELDDLGRCTQAYAYLTTDLMPTEERKAIGHIRPTGWETVKYAGIDGNYLYNRCHLIAFSLAGENDNKKNLITGTRYMNVEGMLPFETEVLTYMKITGNPVLYRVTPVFKDDELLCRGVLMEAASLDDEICFCVFIYNVQPGITIDYATGASDGPAYE